MQTMDLDIETRNWYSLTHFYVNVFWNNVSTNLISGDGRFFRKGNCLRDIVLVKVKE